MATNKHNVKGILISIAFISVVSVAGLLGVDLGHILFIVLVLLFLMLGIIYPVWLTVQSTRDKGGVK